MHLNVRYFIWKNKNKVKTQILYKKCYSNEKELVKTTEMEKL